MIRWWEELLDSRRNRDVLPDSRLRTTVGAKRGPGGTTWVPIFCAICGKFGGRVPEENITFAFYLCNDPCVRLYGPIAGMMMKPDEVFWAEVAAAQARRGGSA